MRSTYFSKYYLISVVVITILGADLCSQTTTEFQTDVQKTIASLEKVDNFPLYVMIFHGDYEFNEYILGTSRTFNSPGEETPHLKDRWACTCFVTLSDEQDIIFGRNFDWYLHPALLLFTNPLQGHAAVSMVDISYLGIGMEELTDADKRQLVNAPYIPVDGMNEHGLIVGMMAVPHAEGGADTQKVTIGSLSAIRLMLDYAKDVDEAISLLQDYNIDFQAGPPVHYLISDSTGNAAVIEILDNTMQVLPATEHWHVATNFILSEVYPENRASQCWRYSTTWDKLKTCGGSLTEQEAMELLDSVSQTNTIWSVVYNANSTDINIAMGRKYNEQHVFNLKHK